MDDGQGYLTIREAAARLNVSYGTVRGAILAGDIQAYRFGPGVGTWRISVDDLTGYIDRCRCSNRTAATGDSQALGG
jgi:excisionase family DNA binding protein